jgi:hypothetical protein
VYGGKVNRKLQEHYDPAQNYLENEQEYGKRRNYPGKPLIIVEPIVRKYYQKNRGYSPDVSVHPLHIDIELYRRNDPTMAKGPIRTGQPYSKPSDCVSPYKEEKEEENSNLSEHKT